MNLFSKFFGKKQEILIVGSQGDAMIAAQKRDGVILYRLVSTTLLLIAVLFSGYFSQDLLGKRESLSRALFEQKAQKDLQQKNTDSLKTISENFSDLKKFQEQVETAIPLTPKEDQVVSLLEHSFKELQKNFRVEIPESISWSPVSETEISNDELLELGIQEFRFTFVGQYRAFLELLKKFERSSRLMDVRSIRGMQYASDIVSADVAFLTYHLLP